MRHVAVRHRDAAVAPVECGCRVLDEVSEGKKSQKDFDNLHDNLGVVGVNSGVNSPWMCVCAGSILWQIPCHRYCNGRVDSWHVPPARRDYAGAVVSWIAG